MLEHFCPLFMLFAQMSLFAQIAFFFLFLYLQNPTPTLFYSAVTHPFLVTCTYTTRSVMLSIDKSSPRSPAEQQRESFRVNAFARERKYDGENVAV